MKKINDKNLNQNNKLYDENMSVTDNLDDKKFILPKHDIMFKTLFREQPESLKELISSLLDIPIDSMGDLTYLNTELIPHYAGNKFSRLDLAVEVNGEQINIEVQLTDEGNFIDRSLYYWSFLYLNGLKKGDNYSSIPKTITINILDFDLFKDDNLYHHTAKLIDSQTKEVFYDKFEIHYYELGKINNKIEPNNSVKLWLQFIKSNSKGDLDMVKSAGYKAVNEAVDTIYKFNEDKKFARAIMLEDIRRHDEA